MAGVDTVSLQRDRFTTLIEALTPAYREARRFHHYPVVDEDRMKRVLARAFNWEVADVNESLMDVAPSGTTSIHHRKARLLLHLYYYGDRSDNINGYIGSDLNQIIAVIDNPANRVNSNVDFCFHESTSSTLIQDNITESTITVNVTYLER